MGCSESRQLRKQLENMLMKYDRVEENVDTLMMDLELCIETNENLMKVIHSMKEYIGTERLSGKNYFPVFNTND